MGHRIGIIGLGTVGSRFVEQFHLHEAFELVAAWDPDSAACDAHRDTTTIVESAAEVIDTADAVYIAVPPLFHREYVEACLESGNAIFCEKPLGIDVAESEALVGAVAASGIAAGVNFVFSAAPSATRLQAMIAAGALGDIVRADLRLHFASWPRAWHAKAQWLRRRDQGGWVREVASHFVFLAGRVLGEVELDSVDVHYPPNGEAEDAVLARFTAGDHVLTLAGASGGAGPDVVDFTVRGTEQSARIWDWYRLQTSSGQDWLDDLGDDRAQLGADAYAAQLAELDKMLTGAKHRISTFEEALAVQRIVEQMLA